MRLALTVLFGVHGLIHLLGFLKWSGIASVPQLRGRSILALSEATSRLFGALWLVAFVALIVAAGMCLRDDSAWWKVALAAVVLSESLIVVAWPDARAGTLVNILLVAPVLVAAAHARFEAQVDAEAQQLIAGARSQGASVVREAEVAALPPPVRRWLEASGIVGRERAHTIRLKQRGAMRTSPDGAWMPVEAVQYFSIDTPGFVWKVETRMMGVLPITGRDRLSEGRGEMLIKAASLLDVVDASDEKIALGAMLRFLGEIVWFPSAAVSPSITWQALDDGHAKATLHDAGKEVSAEFAIDERGRVTAMRAERWYGGGPEAKLMPWTVPITAWSTIRGTEIPVRGSVVWRLPTGEFDYFRWEIVDVETNVPTLYPH